MHLSLPHLAFDRMAVATIKWLTILGLALVVTALHFGAVQAESDELTVLVDNRYVTLDSVTAELNGAPAKLDDVLAVVGTDPFTPTLVQLDNQDGTTMDLPGVEALIHGREVRLDGLEPLLAQKGTISIWIGAQNWRICIIITWGSKNNPVVLVDGREVTVERVLEIQASGQPTTLVGLGDFLGHALVTGTVELDEGNGQIVGLDEVGATVQDNRITLTNLEPLLAERGRLSIWISGEKWRICIIIKWSSRTNLSAVVDGRAADVELVGVEIDGKEDDPHRLLALLGTDEVSGTVQLDEGAGKVTDLPDVQALVKGSGITLSNVEPLLAQQGKLSIWISGKNWRICIILSWGSAANLAVQVDGRPATVDFGAAQIGDEEVELHRLLALLGTGEVSGTVQLDEGGGQIVDLPGVQATMQGGRIRLTGLSPLLAQKGKISIWISGSKWRICIILTWGSDAIARVSVDGREVTVSDLQAQLDGDPIPFERAIAALGGAVVTGTVELSDTVAAAALLPGVVATLEGNQIRLAGLSNLMAARPIFSIWITVEIGDITVRICITIGKGGANTPLARLNGRAVTAYDAVAEFQGKPEEPLRLLTLAATQPFTGTKVEVVTGGVTETVPAQAVLDGSTLILTDVPPNLASRPIFSVWVTLGEWRICIIISTGIFRSEDDVVALEIPAHDLYTHIVPTYTPSPTGTHPLPAGKRGLHFFTLVAQAGGQPVTQLDVEYKLKVDYEDAELGAAGAAEAGLELAFYDEATGQWVPIPTEVDESANQVTGTLDHFTAFVLWGDELEDEPYRIFAPLVDQ